MSLPLPAELLIPILTFFAVVFIGAAIVATRTSRRRSLEHRLGGAGQTEPAAGREGAGEVGAKGKRRLLARIARLFSAGKPSESLRAHLARAGFHDGSAAAIFLGSKMLLLFVGILAALALTLMVDVPVPAQLLGVATGGVLLSFLPNIVVSIRRERRCSEVRRHLPDAIDLLEICVSSGMGMDMAWNAVSDEIRRVSSTLADEMALANLEMHLGATRTVSLRHMVERTGAEELGSLVAILVQSERFGTSVTEALRTFSSSLRVARSQRAEESAEKMAVKLLFPMVLFIFPAMLVVVAGPAGLLLMEHILRK